MARIDRTTVLGACALGALLALATSRAVPSAHAARPQQILIPGKRVFPENITSTSDGTVIIGSIGHEAIYRARPGSSRATVWIPPRAHGIQGIFGVLADEKSNTLWACSNSLGPPRGPPHPRPAVYAFDLATGAFKARYAFPTPGAFCNDVAIGPHGAAYATDTYNMQVVRLAPGAHRFKIWSEHGFGPKGTLLDDIVILDGRVIVDVLRTGKLYGVAIERGGRAGPIEEIALDRPLAAPDGLERLGRDGVLVAEGGAGGRLSLVTLHGDRGHVVTVKQGFPEGPVGVTVIGDTAYLLLGQLATLFSPNYNAHTPTKPFHAVAVHLGAP